MSNNSLIEVKDNIFTRIFKSIKSFFFKPKVALNTNNADLSQEIEEANIDKTSEVSKPKEENKKIYKEKIFDLYKQVKKRQIDLETIDIQDLEKIKKLLKEELRIKKERLEKKKIELKMCKNELKMLNG